MATYKTGDVVEFRARGMKLTGTVTGTRWRESRKKQRLVAQLGLQDVETGCVMVRIVPTNRPDSYWEVPEGHVIQKVGEQNAAPALETVSKIKRRKRELTALRETRNHLAVRNNDLTMLKPGDKVEVKYSNRSFTTTETFRRFSGSGQVGIDNLRGGVRWLPPHIVTLSKKEEPA